jgi:hypothetical protein
MTTKSNDCGALPTTYPGNDDAPRGIKQTLLDMETNN